jgi:hypothetical protein
MNKDFIVTISKKRFSPLEAEAGDIEIADIAHALSLLCRANGYIRHFYSVAQHSLNCAAEAKARGFSEDVQLACLLHDASEAYISDVTRPVKRSLPKYIEIEEALQKVIFGKYNLSHLGPEGLAAVAEVDDCLLYYEMLDLMGEKVIEGCPVMAGIPDLRLRDFFEVKAAFLAEFERLAGALNK